MSEQIREQVSAFLDGELPNSETELLLKRLTRDPELRESFGRYALMGESMRGGGARLSHGFHARVNRAIDGEPRVVHAPVPNPRLRHWWRPFAGAAVAAGVASVAVLALQHRTVAPLAAANGVAFNGGGIAVPVAENAGRPHEAISYTVPAAVADAPAALPAARLTNYVFAHSKYSSVLGQSNVLSGLLTDADEQDAAARGAGDPSGQAANDAVRRQAKGAHDGTP